MDIWKKELVTPLSNQLTPFIINIISKDRLENGYIDSTNARCALISLVDVGFNYFIANIILHYK